MMKKVGGSIVKIYQLYKTTAKNIGGLGEHAEITTIDYYYMDNMAVYNARKLATNGAEIVMYYPDRLNKKGTKGVYLTLDGEETRCPYDAYVVKEIEVK